MSGTSARVELSIAPGRQQAHVSDAQRGYLIYFASISGMVLLWYFVSTAFFQPLFFPNPVTVFRTGWEMLRSGELGQHVLISMQRILLGFFIGSAIGTPIGLVMGANKTIRTVLEPYAQFFRFVPSIAWLTPVVIWFGIGETSKVLIIIYTTTF